jgi:hypothetical protein
VPQQSSLFLTAAAGSLTDLKHRIRQVQLRASLAVNEEMIILYWEIDREILKEDLPEPLKTSLL